MAIHILGLGQTHKSKDCRCNVAKHTVGLLQAPELRCVGHDKGNLVGGVRCLGGALLCEHLLGVSRTVSTVRTQVKRVRNLPVISSDEEDVAAFLALVVDLLDGLVGLRAGFNSCLVDTSVADHIRRCEVVHQELELACLNPFAKLLGNSHGAHFRLEVVCGYLWRRHHLTLFVLKLLLDTTVEKEGNVSILLRLSNVTLLYALLSERLCKDIVHSLRWKSDRECVLGVVCGHGRQMDVAGVRKVGPGRAVEVTQQLGDFANAVGTVVEEENRILICMHELDQSHLGTHICDLP